MLVYAYHSLAEVLRQLGKELGVLVVGYRLHYCGSPLGWVAALEYAAAHEDALCPQLHHEGGVGWCGYAAGGKIHYGQLAVLVYVAHELIGCLQLLGSLEEFVVGHAHEPAYLALHQAHVAHCLHYVARAWLALGAYHGGTLGYAPESLTQVARSAHEGHSEPRLVYVVDIVGRREHLALVYVVYLDGLQYLRLGYVAYAALRHHGYAHRLLYAPYHLGVAHAAHAPRRPYVGRYALQRHHGTRASLLGYACLLGGCHVHYHSALQHLCQLAVQGLSVFHCFFAFFLGGSRSS